MPTWKIVLGDCLEAMKTMPDCSIDMIFTDPPYGYSTNDVGSLTARREFAFGGDISKSKPRPIANDGPEADDVFGKFLLEAKRVMKPKGSCCCCCCCGGGGPDPMFARWSLEMDKVLTFKQMIVWDKGPMGMGHHYRRSYETVLVAHKGATCKWYDTSKTIENIIRPADNIASKIIPSEHQHPTEKPVGLSAFFIKLHTLPDDTVLDPFMGSGSTGVAALQTGRNFIGIEISPDYCAMARRRLQNECGLIAKETT